MKLKSITSVKQAPQILYRLLASRPAKVNISHKKMPSRAEHLDFIRRRPYKAWYLIEVPPHGFIGSAYLSKGDEIGIFLFKRYQGEGYGSGAVRLLMKKHPSVKRFLANISPRNKASQFFFRKMGFRHIQNTYELTPSRKTKGNA